MGPVEEAIFFEIRDQSEYYTWRAGWVEFDSGAGVIGMRGETALLVTIPAHTITGFEITMREEISILSHIALGALLADSNTGYGCLLSLILAPAAAIDRIITKRTHFPVIRLTQSMGAGLEQESMIWIRSRRRGRRGREQTRELANRLAGMLRESDYGGTMPDLSNDELWFDAG